MSGHSGMYSSNASVDSQSNASNSASEPSEIKNILVNYYFSKFIVYNFRNSYNTTYACHQMHVQSMKQSMRYIHEVVFIFLCYVRKQ